MIPNYAGRIDPIQDFHTIHISLQTLVPLIEIYPSQIWIVQRSWTFSESQNYSMTQISNPKYPTAPSFLFLSAIKINTDSNQTHLDRSILLSNLPRFRLHRCRSPSSSGTSPPWGHTLECLTSTKVISKVLQEQRVLRLPRFKIMLTRSFIQIRIIAPS